MPWISGNWTSTLYSAPRWFQTGSVSVALPAPLGSQPHAPLSAIEFSFEPEDFRTLLHTHEASECLRWWQAWRDPSYARDKARTPQDGRDGWARAERTDIRHFRALVQGASRFHKLVQAGLLQANDLVVTTMPDEMPLALHDWIIPMGKDVAVPNTLPDARTSIEKELIIRGEGEVEGAGLVSASGTTVTGTGTLFASFFHAGDIIEAAGQARRIESVASDLSLTIESGLSPNWNQNKFVKRADRLPRAPSALIEDIRDANQVYVTDRDFRLGEDEATVEWLSASNSPAMATQYSVIYQAYAKYIVRDDLGFRRRTVNGVALPQRVRCVLVNG